MAVLQHCQNSMNLTFTLNVHYQHKDENLTLASQLYTAWSYRLHGCAEMPKFYTDGKGYQILKKLLQYYDEI